MPNLRELSEICKSGKEMRKLEVEVKIVLRTESYRYRSAKVEPEVKAEVEVGQVSSGRFNDSSIFTCD